MPALDCERVAAVYDKYCVYTGDLEFGLTAARRMLDLAEAAGFACAGLLGSYDGAPFEEATSPVIIALLDRPA